MRTRFNRRAGFLAVALGLSALAPAAHADPVTYFSFARQFQFSDIGGFCFTSQFNSNGGSASAGQDCTTSSGSETVTSNAAAAANLGAGTLKAVADVDNQSSGGSTAHAEAMFGDSFRTTTGTGTPFTWNSSTSVSFNLDIDGSVSSSYLVNGSGVELQIFEPGTLDTYVAYQQSGDPDLLAAVTAQRIAIFAWGLGLVNYSPLNGTVVVFPDTLEAEFNPDGDFDWVLRLVTNVAPSGGSSAVADFFNTLEMSYVGPDGGVTYSASGVFPGTLALAAVSLPTPGTLGLLLPGLLMIGLTRRRQGT